MAADVPAVIRVTRGRMTWLLRPGVGLARRDADHLQLGVDPPLAAVLPDSRRRAAAAGRAGPRRPAHHPRRDDRRRCSTRWSPPGWSWPPTGPPRDATGAPAAPVHLDAPDGRAAGPAPAGGRSGAACSPAPGGRGHGGAGLERGRAAAGAAGRLDAGRHARTWWSARARAAPCSAPTSSRAPPPACAASTRTSASTIPRRALVVEQLATTPPLRPAEPDPALRALAVAWAVHDLSTAADGGVPATWSATVSLGGAPADGHGVPAAPALRLRLGRGAGRAGGR